MRTMLPKQMRYRAALLPDRPESLVSKAFDPLAETPIRGNRRQNEAGIGKANPGIVPEDVRGAFCEHLATLSDLARVRAVFQLRAVLAAMGVV